MASTQFIDCCVTTIIMVAYEMITKGIIQNAHKFARLGKIVYFMLLDAYGTVPRHTCAHDTCDPSCEMKNTIVHIGS